MALQFWEGDLNVSDLNVVVLAYSRANTFEKVIKVCERHLERITVVMDFPADDIIAEEQEKIMGIIINLEIPHVVFRRDRNHGLVQSVLTTITQELYINDHIVLLEDDCVPREGFFEFMASSLEHYRHDDNVTSVCGTRTSCPFNPWGWATWRDKWEYRHLSQDEIMDIPSLDDSLRLFLQDNTVEGSIWSLSWLASQYANNRKCIFPKRTLVDNIGFDSSGVHSGGRGYTKWLLSQVEKE